MLLRAPHLGQQVTEPFPGVDKGPGTVLVIAFGVVHIGGNARQQPHAFQKGDPLARLRRDMLPVLERLTQLLPVDLDPLPAQHDQSVVSRHQLAPFRLGQLLVAQSQLHLEVEQSARIELPASGITDGHPHPRSRPLLPPIGHPHQDAALFQHRHVLKKAIRVTGRPGQRLVQVARVDQLLHQHALLRCLVHRREEPHQGLLVAGSGQFAQCAAQRLILNAGSRHDTGA